MDENGFQVGFCVCNKGLFNIKYIYFVYILEGFITLN